MGRAARAFGAGVLVAGGWLAAACGGGGGGSSSLTGPPRALTSIADTPVSRSFVAVNDLHRVWTSAGLSFPPTLAQLASPAASAVAGLLPGSSLIGSRLWEFPTTASPLGYNSLALTSEVVAGEGADQLSEVGGDIDASKVNAALSGMDVATVFGGDAIRYTNRDPAALPHSPAAALFGVANLAVLRRGGHAASGGPNVPAGDVLTLLRGSQHSPSLAQDTDIRQMLGELQGADALAFGTSLIVKGQDVPQIANLPAAPTFAGYGYLPGRPSTPAAVAVATYPNAHDARAAAGVVGDVLRSGTSPRSHQPYAQLFTLQAIAVHGNTVVARLTDLHGGSLKTAVQQADFPLFWSPLPTRADG